MVHNHIACTMTGDAEEAKEEGDGEGHPVSGTPIDNETHPLVFEFGRCWVLWRGRGRRFGRRGQCVGEGGCCPLL